MQQGKSVVVIGTDEFMRRFLLHVLPGGLHRIRHYGLLANGGRRASLALARELLHVVLTQARTAGLAEQAGALPTAAPPAFICRHCGHPMVILQTLVRGGAIRAPPPS